MYEETGSTYYQNKIIDFESPNYNAETEIRIISEYGGVTNRAKTSAESVLDEYMKSKAVPLVLRKRIMYQRSLLV